MDNHIESKSITSERTDLHSEIEAHSTPLCIDGGAEIYYVLSAYQLSVLKKYSPERSKLLQKLEAAMLTNFQASISASDKL